MNKLKRQYDQVCMDTINSWLLDLHERIEADVTLTVEQQEHLEAIIYGNISNYLEKFFNYPDYSNYN